MLNIGPCPPGEDCVQVGAANYEAEAKRECNQYILLLREALGNEPAGAQLAVKRFSHDMGGYYEVVCYYDEDNETAVEYAFKCEGDGPENWNDTVKKPQADDADFADDDLIEVPAGRRPYLGEPPTCDLAKVKEANTKDHTIKNEFSDAATTFGSWANMCKDCASQFGRGYGIGLGQRYQKAKDGQFYKVE